MLHRATPRGAMLAPKRRWPEVRFTFLSPMILDYASLSISARTTSMDQYPAITIEIMILFLVTLSFIELEADLMLTHGCSESVPIWFLPLAASASTGPLATSASTLTTT